jgi:hypothetical protein
VSDHRHVHAGSVLSQSPGQARGHALMPGGGGVMDVCLLVVGVDVGLSWCVCVCVLFFDPMEVFATRAGFCGVL